MSKGRSAALVAVALLLAIVFAACGGDDNGGNNLLAAIEDKKTLTVSTDPAYPPQSKLNEKTGKYEGFDIDVATEIAKRLGVEVAWEAPAWDTIIAGNWNGRWDVSVLDDITRSAQGAVPRRPTTTRPPRSRARGQYVISDASGLDGKKIGACRLHTTSTYRTSRDGAGRVGRSGEIESAERAEDPHIRH
jgi:polar amino acid transport system substrate-binding protein